MTATHATPQQDGLPASREDKLRRGLTPSAQSGAEIGPLGRPVVGKHEGPVVYVDHADTEAIRRKYANDAAVDTSRIHVDAVWGERTLKQALAGADDGRDPELDYVIASHVIEHVPDLVSWLGEVRAVLKADGTLRVAVPDRRYTFDHLRRESNISDVLAAHVRRDRRPSAHAVLDFCLHYGPLNAADAWAGRVDVDAMRRASPYSFEAALALARDSQDNGAYHDVHCWVFTPTSFAELCATLARHALIDFGCTAFFDTEPGHHEFIVLMRPEPRAPERIESWQRMAASARPQWAASSAPATPLCQNPPPFG